MQWRTYMRTSRNWRGLTKKGAFKSAQVIQQTESTFPCLGLRQRSQEDGLHFRSSPLREHGLKPHSKGVYSSSFGLLLLKRLCVTSALTLVMLVGVQRSSPPSTTAMTHSLAIRVHSNGPKLIAREGGICVTGRSTATVAAT